MSTTRGEPEGEPVSIGILPFPPSQTPAPLDLAYERSLIFRILDDLEAQCAPHDAICRCEGITEWVSWQLGCIASGYASATNIQMAIPTAIAAVLSADIGHWTGRSIANRATLAEILVLQHEFVLADSICRAALLIASPRNRVEYASLHSILAVSAAFQKKPFSAALHVDSVLRCMLDRLDDPILRDYATGAINIYRDANDVVGLLICHRILEGREAAHAAWRNACAGEVAQLSCESRITVASRLHAFRMDDFAAVIENPTPSTSDKGDTVT